MNLRKKPKFFIPVIISALIISTLCFNVSCKGDVSVEETASASEIIEGKIEETEIETSAERMEEKTDEAVEEESVEENKKAVESKETTESEKEVTEEAMKIESPAFKNNEMIPSKYTCDGENINPPLKISGIPENALSLVLIVDDPDAPAKTWVHWTMWNIDPETVEIPENSVPKGAVQGITDFRVPGYGGPCPPSGAHRYFFKLYALDITLNLESSATVGNIEEAMKGHILGSAELIGLYKRS